MSLISTSPPAVSATSRSWRAGSRSRCASTINGVISTGTSWPLSAAAKGGVTGTVAMYGRLKSDPIRVGGSKETRSTLTRMFVAAPANRMLLIETLSVAEFMTALTGTPDSEKSRKARVSVPVIGSKPTKTLPGFPWVMIRVDVNGSRSMSPSSAALLKTCAEKSCGGGEESPQPDKARVNHASINSEMSFFINTSTSANNDRTNNIRRSTN